jgi:hypothetical protein
MLKPAVTSKRDYYQRAALGEFGNQIKSWLSLGDFFSDPEKKFPVAVRYMEPGSPFCVMDLASSKDVWEATDKMSELGADLSLMVVNECAPDDKLTIQGELCERPGGAYLHYSTKRGYRMREGLAKFGRHITGLGSILTLAHFMDPTAFDAVRQLLQEYPEHVIEFSCYTVGVGTLGWNTIIWEVRAY